MVRHDKLDFLDAYKDDENYRKRKIECLEQNLDLVSAKLAYTNAKWGSLTRQYKQKVKKTQCVVCMDADANMSFVHGNTAHLACCEACAEKFCGLFAAIHSDTEDDDNKISRCPVCRQQIHKIVKQF